MLPWVGGGATGGIPPSTSGSSICFCVVSGTLGLGVLVQAVVESVTPNAKDAINLLEGYVVSSFSDLSIFTRYSSAFTQIPK